LPIVLALTALLQVLALAQADLGWVALRDAGARRDRLLADTAAEAALVICSRLLQQGRIPVYPWTGPGEPAGWQAPQAFSGSAPLAYSLGPRWPAPTSPPQCLAEARPAVSGAGHVPAAQIVVLTARAVGLDAETQSYQQRLWRVASGVSPASSPQGWRNVAAVPD